MMGGQFKNKEPVFKKRNLVCNTVYTIFLNDFGAIICSLNNYFRLIRFVLTSDFSNKNLLE